MLITVNCLLRVRSEAFSKYEVRFPKQYDGILRRIYSTHRTNGVLFLFLCFPIMHYAPCKGPKWSWSYGSLIYSYLCNQCLSPIKLRARTLSMARCTWYNTIWSSTSITCDRSMFFSGNWVSSTNKTDRHDITEIVLKVTINTIIPYTCSMHLLENQSTQLCVIVQAYFPER